MSPGPRVFPIWTGDDVGLLKKWTYIDGSASSKASSEVNAKIWSEPTVNRGASIQWMQTVTGVPEQIWVARKGGIVENYNTLERKAPESIFVATKEADKHLNFIGFHVDRERIATCTSEGVVEYRGNPHGGDQPLEAHSQIPMGSDLNRVRFLKGMPAYFATGGKERELSVYDLHAKSHDIPIFQAKNVKNNHLDLREPVCVTDVQFLDENRKDELVIGTGYGQIRLYDARTSRRPVSSIKVGEYPIRCVQIVPNCRDLMFSDSASGFFHMDIRAGKTIGTFKETSGAVVDIQFDPNNANTVGCCSVDRYVRIYDLKTRKLLHKLFTKQRLGCMLFGDNPNFHIQAQEREDDGLDALETVLESVKCKKQRIK